MKTPKFETHLQRQAYFLGCRHAVLCGSIHVSSLPAVLQLFYVVGGLDCVLNRPEAASTARPQRSEDGLRAAAPQALPPATNRGGKVFAKLQNENLKVGVTA